MRAIAVPLLLMASLGWVATASAQSEAEPTADAGGSTSASPDTSDSTSESPDAAPTDPYADLDGDTIYRRILDNRFNSYEQSLRMESGNQGGATQATEIDMRYLNFRGNSKKILSKTIAKYQDPLDVRHLGYLVVNKRKGVDDQFIYRPSSRRVRRVNLRGESVFGTDFSFEDIIPQEFEDGTYLRMPDERVDEIDCFVVQVTPTEKAESEYSKMLVYAQRENYVPIKTLYWDKEDVLIKEMKADPISIQRFEDEEDGKPKVVWVAQRMRMDHLKLLTWTDLDITELRSNPGLRNRDFSERQLTSSH